MCQVVLRVKWAAEAPSPGRHSPHVRLVVKGAAEAPLTPPSLPVDVPINIFVRLLDLTTEPGEPISSVGEDIGFPSFIVVYSKTIKIPLIFGCQRKEE